MGCAYCDKKLAIVFVAFFMLRWGTINFKKWDSALLAENFRRDLDLHNRTATIW
jgi:hypothetical protein